MSQIVRKFTRGRNKVVDCWGNIFYVCKGWTDHDVKICPQIPDGCWEDIWNEKLNQVVEGKFERVCENIEVFFDYERALGYVDAVEKLWENKNGETWLWVEEREELREIVGEGDIDEMKKDAEEFNFEKSKDWMEDGGDQI